MKKLFALLCALGVAPALAVADEPSGPKCEGCDEGQRIKLEARRIDLHVQGADDNDPEVRKHVRVLVRSQDREESAAEPDERLVDALHRIHQELRRLNQRVDRLEQGERGGRGQHGDARPPRPPRPDGPFSHDLYSRVQRPPLAEILPRILPQILPHLRQFKHGDAHAFIKRLHDELERRCEAGDCPLKKLKQHLDRMQQGGGPEEFHRFMQRAFEHGFPGPQFPRSYERRFEDDDDDDDGDRPRRKKVQQPRSRDGHGRGHGRIHVPEDLQALFPEGVDIEELLNEAWPELQEELPEGADQTLQQTLKNWKQIMRQQGIEPDMAREYLRGVDPQDLEGLKAMLPSLLKRFKHDPRFQRAQEELRRAHEQQRDGIQQDQRPEDQRPQDQQVTGKRYL